MPRIVVGFVGVVVVMLAVPALLAWSGSRRRLRVGRSGGAVHLRMPRGHHAVMAVVAALPFATFAGLALAVTWKPGNEAAGRTLGVVMALAAAAAGGYLLALEARGRIRLDDFAIEKTGVFRRRRVAWGDVTALTFNPVNHWFFLTARGGGRVYFVEGLDGIGDFAELALRRLPPEVLAASPEAVEALEELAGA